MPISYRAAQNLIKRGDESGLRAALGAGLDPNLANENRWSLLMLAAVEGSVPLATLLLDHGADPSRENANGQTALSIALSRNHTALTHLLSPSNTPPTA